MVNSSGFKKILVMIVFLIVASGCISNPSPDNINNSGDYLALGDEFYEQMDFDKALLYYDRAVTLEDNNSEAWFSKGAALAELGENEEALKAYDRSLQINESDYRVWSYRGVALHRLGRIDDAFESQDKALEYNPRYWNALHNKGTLLINVGRYEEALEYYDKAIEYHNDSAFTLFAKGRLFIKLQSYKTALNPLQAALRIQEQKENWNEQDRRLTSAIHSSIGEAQYKLGDYDNATESFRKALEISPDNEEAIEWMKRIDDTSR